MRPLCLAVKRLPRMQEVVSSNPTEGKICFSQFTLFYRVECENLFCKTNIKLKVLKLNKTKRYHSLTVIQLWPAVQFRIIELSIVDYTPTHGTSILTSDSCSAYEETYSHLVLGHNNVGKYFSPLKWR